jgi:hypothetical protein
MKVEPLPEPATERFPRRSESIRTDLISMLVQVFLFIRDGQRTTNTCDPLVCFAMIRLHLARRNRGCVN